MNRDLRAALVAEPWLKPWLKDDDDTIEPARRRFEVDQRAVLRRLAAEGVELHKRFTKGDGAAAMLTTANDHSDKAVRR